MHVITDTFVNRLSALSSSQRSSAPISTTRTA